MLVFTVRPNKHTSLTYNRKRYKPNHCHYQKTENLKYRYFKCILNFLLKALVDVRLIDRRKSVFDEIFFEIDN